MRYDVILLDMNFTQGTSSGREGFLWLERILEADPAAVVVLITAYGDVEKAVRAMKAGATDFVVKPWHNEKLIATVQAGLRLRRSRHRAARPTVPPAAEAQGAGAQGAGAQDDPYALLGRSPAMHQVFEAIAKVARTEANVLILGEHGTGKELVARAVHRQSMRSARPFVGVDLGALSAGLFESELFGHLKGAFTGAVQDRPGRFEQAEGGALFLDEIGNIPLPLQRKLLTVLERREVTRVGSVASRPIDLRLICATNMPIYDMAAAWVRNPLAETLQGSERLGFRQDLLYRVNTVEIRLPPLRDRRDDIPLLAGHFARLHAHRYGRPVPRLSEAALEALQAYRWPGNVRELRNTLERALIMSEAPVLDRADFHFSTPPPEPDATAERLDLEEIERTAIRKALSKHGGNISRAAEELGLTRRSLYRRIEKYGL
jgi:DNA-binding NtrC family response regulator